MQSSLGRPNYLKLSVRARDFFVDFLACLIPGFITLSMLTILFVGIIVLFFNNINLPSDNSIDLPKSILLGIHEKLGLTFWVHIALVACSYAFGFMLFRQDPKNPDYASYIKNRKKVNDYTAWVIPRDKGLSPKDVQFPYSDLAKYLKSRGFQESMVKNIHWTSEKPNEESAGAGKNRSKSFINQLKTRISFFFPDSTFQIIKNEAHIRFSSSLWYGMKFLTSILYLVLVIFLTITIQDSASTSKIINDSNFALIFCILVVYTVTKFEKIISKFTVKNEKIINFWTTCIKNLNYIYNIFPLTVSLLLLYQLYIYYQVSPSIYYIPLIYITIVLSISVITFYMIEKIEDSFHYQRVREIIYVLETANMSKVDDQKMVEKLWEAKCCSNENEVILKNIQICPTTQNKNHLYACITDGRR